MSTALTAFVRDAENRRKQMIDAEAQIDYIAARAAETRENRRIAHKPFDYAQHELPSLQNAIAEYERAREKYIIAQARLQALDDIRDMLVAGDITDQTIRDFGTAN